MLVDLSVISRKFNKLTKDIATGHYLHIPTSVKNTVLLSSMGRSGSTWLASIVNADNRFREIFEPFLPSRIPEASFFEYCQYLNPAETNTIFISAAEQILTGRIRKNIWTDSGNRRIFSTRCLVKDIRTNLMLGWMKRTFPAMKIVLLIRNPFSVVESYLNLGWGIEPSGRRREIDILLSQAGLLKDYPDLRAVSSINFNDPFEMHFAQWCILNYVPLVQRKDFPFYVIHYERLLQDPVREIEGLFSYLNVPFTDKVFNALKRPSRTAYNRKEFSVFKVCKDNDRIARGLKILEKFNMQALYDWDLLQLPS